MINASTVARRDAFHRKEFSEMETSPRWGMGSSPAAPAEPAAPATGDPPAVTPPAPAPSTSTADGEIAKVYDKLRNAEKERDDARKELKQVKEKDLPEADRIKQENEELKTANSTLTSDLTKYAGERVATALGFVDPEAAVAILTARGTDISDEAKTRKALTDLAKEKENMVSGTAPPDTPSGGPVNPVIDPTPAGDKGMNDTIRRMAGRQ